MATFGNAQLVVDMKLEDDNTRTTTSIDKYKYVHQSIRNILLKMESPNITADIHPFLVNKNSYTIKWNELDTFVSQSEPQYTLSFEQLTTLASQSERALMGDDDDNKLRHSVLPSPLRGLLQIIPKKKQFDVDKDDGEYYLIATSIALNLMESSIRHLIGKQNGRAPLLKDMIDSISTLVESDNAFPKSLEAVLRTILLPKDGMNLRNLIWHGFVPTIHRRWLALSIVVILSLDELADSSSFQRSFSLNDKDSLQPIAAMRQHTTLVAILDHGRGIMSCSEKLNSFERKIIQSQIIPRSHVDLFRVSLKLLDTPILFASVAVPLIEHIIRLMWCCENKQNKYIAEPGSYYCTLDGHGQRDKHDVMLLPYLSSCSQITNNNSCIGQTREIRNQLVSKLGGPSMAFLTDLFLSPSGAPNIRASVCHGSFNKYLFEELFAIEEDRVASRKNNDELMDVTNSLVSVIDILCDATSRKSKIIMSSYRPCFSYSASLIAEIDRMVDAMKPFYRFIRDGNHLEYARNVSQTQTQIEITKNVANMSQAINAIVDLQEGIIDTFKLNKATEFTGESFFNENLNNLISSECGAAKLLLFEIAHAASSSLRILTDGISRLEDDTVKVSSRQRKQVYRICSSAELTLDFYSFAAYCALLYIGRRQDIVYCSSRISQIDELFVVVKRSRMVVSTFSTTKTFDRALTALKQYMAGKAVKAIHKDIQRSSFKKNHTIKENEIS